MQKLIIALILFASSGLAQRPAGSPSAPASSTPFAPLVQSAAGDVVCALHADSITGLTCDNQVVDGTTETPFTNGVSIPAGTLSANTISMNTAFLAHTSNGTTPTIVFRLRLGGASGTIIYQSASIAPVVGSTDVAFNYQCNITSLAAASGTTPVVVTCATPTIGASALNRNTLLTNAALSVAADTTTTKTLLWTIQYSANTAANAIALYGMSPGSGGPAGPPGPNGTSTLGASASVPSPARNGETTTGLYSSGTGAVDISSLGTQVFHVQSNGYVGIGTSSPAAVLDINGQLDLGGVQGIAFPTVDTTTNGTVAIGSGAATSLPASAAYSVVAIGYQALGGIANTTAALSNTAVGYQTLLANTSGANSTAVGYQALAAATTTTNTAIGYKALSTGNPNSSTAVGFNANNAGALTNGVSIGSNSCSVCTGTGDTAVGANAGRYISSGARNVAVGQNAIQGITGTRVTGADNTAIGDQAGLLLQGAAASNTLIGSSVGSTITTGTNNILIGMSSSCAPTAITTSNETIICGPSAASVKITGNGTVGTEVVTINGLTTMTTSGAGASATLTNSAGSCTHTPGAGSETVSCSSDAKLKENIQQAGDYADWLSDFQVREYTVKSTGQQTTGVIAQEVQKVHPEMVHALEDGTLTVEQPNVWKLVKVIQEMQAQIAELRAR